MQWSISSIDFFGERIFCRKFVPKEHNNCALVLLHGRYTHSEYWDLIATEEQAYSFFAFDYPGQGRSSGKRGSCDTYKTLPILLQAFLENFVGKSYHRLYLIGESLGSLLAFYAIVNLRTRVDGIVMLPGVFSFKRKDFLLASILAFFVPNITRRNRKSFDWYTSNPLALQMLKADPYYCRLSSIRYDYGILRLTKYMLQNANHLTVPTLIFCGAKDHYSDMEHVQRFIGNLPTTVPRDLVVLDNSKHWLLVGAEIGLIKQELFKWLLKMEKQFRDSVYR